MGDKSTAKPVRKYDLAATDREIRKSRPEAKTIFEALQELYPNCTYTQGCDYLDPTQTDFAAALAAAESADAVILCLSGKNGWGRHCDTGEGNDASSLDLPGAQEELARVVLAANPRTIVTHTDGRPLTSPHIYANAAAILEAFTPGTWGGTELAALIAGIHSPAGCLPLPLPRTAGHEPMFMAEHRGTTGQSFVAGSLNPDGYWQSDFRPLRPFGYGLSYTTFAYEALNLIVDPDALPKRWSRCITPAAATARLWCSCMAAMPSPPLCGRNWNCWVLPALPYRRASAAPCGSGSISTRWLSRTNTVSGT